MPHARPTAARPLLALLATLVLGHATIASAQIELTDDAGQRVVLAQPAQRIVSLAPHVTEILFAAGAGEHVVGVVAYSDYPQAARALPQVGGYTQVDLEAIVGLRPDLVIGWRSGNRDAHLARLQAMGIPVYLNEPRSLDDVARSLEQFGRLAGSEDAAHAAATAFRTRHAALETRITQSPDQAGALRRQQRQIDVDIEAIHGVATLRGWPTRLPEGETP